LSKTMAWRGVFRSVGKIVVGATSVQLGATAAAVTFDEKKLKKRPEWYKEAVNSLEDTLKKLSRYGFIESEEVLTQAEDRLSRAAETNHPEILWRLGRALIEKAELSHNTKEKVALLREAKKHLQKAVDLEPSQGIAGAHKWLAVALCKLSKLDKDVKKEARVYEEKVQKHLEHATKLDPKDPYAWHLLGVHLFHNKDYKEAAKYLEKAEDTKSNFSAANLYFLGHCLYQNGDKEKAKEVLKKALLLPSKNKLDSKGKSDAKKVLITKLKIAADEIVEKDL
jgi:tetratricopeptide (TPR) repeat protein